MATGNFTHIPGSGTPRRRSHPHSPPGENRGASFTLLRCVHRETGVPMVLNTSFNGRGEPIVETPQNALAFLLNTTLDALYIDGYRVTRAD
jgi:predicted NodU family carbamoyl transferase